jgi:predicted XRE-type DNA-binding protein
MLRRCRNTSHHAFKSYGGRGITVCDKWLHFDGFFEDMGLKPSELTLERIDNNLGYSKDNCKWATRTEQARNTRATKLTEEIVVVIKKLISQGVSQYKIASMFNVSRSNIGHIAQGATWV